MQVASSDLFAITVGGLGRRVLGARITIHPQRQGIGPTSRLWPGRWMPVAGYADPIELNGNKDAEFILILKDIKLNLRTLCLSSHKFPRCYVVFRSKAII
jgi:hypothetical protein